MAEKRYVRPFLQLKSKDLLYFKMYLIRVEFVNYSQILLVMLIPPCLLILTMMEWRLCYPRKNLRNFLTGKSSQFWHPNVLLLWKVLLFKYLIQPNLSWCTWSFKTFRKHLKYFRKNSFRYRTFCKQWIHKFCLLEFSKSSREYIAVLYNSLKNKYQSVFHDPIQRINP